MADIFVSEYDQYKTVSAYIDNKLEYLSVIHPTVVGNIYVCRVDNIIKNLGSAFVRYGEDRIGYLSLKGVHASSVLNRSVERAEDIRQGDTLVLQVESDEIKNKKTKMTSQISVSGDYSVVTLGRKGAGASLKLPQDIRTELLDELRDDYKDLCESSFDNLYGNTFGVIIRTQAISLSPEERKKVILDDLRNCLFTLLDILKNARTRTVYSCLYNSNGEDIEEHLKRASNFLLSRGITEYQVLTESVVYDTKLEIDKLKKNRVWLNSGAFLIIEQLESFNAIDVNTGKAVSGKKDIISKVNKEAAKEIFRQIRLRNLSGMILIDFINMKDKEAEEELCDYVKALAKKEPVHTQFIDITGLGIVELVRNKNAKSLKELIYNNKEPLDM